MKEEILLKSRYEDTYKLSKVDDGSYKFIMSNTEYLRVGGTNDNIIFIDPPGGPFIEVNYELPEVGKVVKEIIYKDDYYIVFE